MLLKKSFGLFPIAALLLFGSVGCDTVAKISFQERDFSKIHSPGFLPDGGDCTAMSGGDAAFRFVLLADDQTAIRPLQAVSRTEFTPMLDNFSFLETALFEKTECRLLG